MTRTEAARALAEAARRYMDYTGRDTFEDLQRALVRFEDAAPEDDGWRPIETAPKTEGEWIFASAGNKIPMVTGWDEDGQMWFTFNLVFENVYHRQNPSWRWEPTHWMPLPPPPAEPAP